MYKVNKNFMFGGAIYMKYSTPACPLGVVSMMQVLSQGYLSLRGLILLFTLKSFFIWP